MASVELYATAEVPKNKVFSNFVRNVQFPFLKICIVRLLQRLLAALLAFLNNPLRVIINTSQICNTRSFQETTKSHKFSLKIVDTHYTVNYKRISG